MKNIAIMAMAAMLSMGIAEAKDNGTVTVTPASQDADAANGGVIYSLPKTMLRIRVEAEVTMKKVGPYYKYSNKYLNLTDVVTEDSKKWKLSKVTIETYGKANESQMYKISGSGMPAVLLNSNGILAGINAEKAEQRVKHRRANVEEDNSNNELPVLSFDDVRLDRSVLTKTSTAAMAEEAALTIYKLREKRMSLLGGEEATILNDEGSYNKVFEELDKMERQFVSLFAGKVEKVKVVKYYDVEPGATSMNSIVLFRFSETDGFMDAMDITGKPVYVDMEFGGAKVNSYDENSKLRKQNPLSGLRYVIPGTVKVKIIDRNILLTEKEIECAQSGRVATLPIEMLMGGYSIKLNTVSGALVGVEKEKNPVERKK